MKDNCIETSLSLSMSLRRTRGDRQLKDGEVMYPVGYSDKPVPDTSVQEADRNLVEKVKLHIDCNEAKITYKVNVTMLYTRRSQPFQT